MGAIGGQAPTRPLSTPLMKGEVAVDVKRETGGRNSREGRLDQFSRLTYTLPTWMPAGPKPYWFGWRGAFVSGFGSWGLLTSWFQISGLSFRL